jgi:hypothetical protein
LLALVLEETPYQQSESADLNVYAEFVPNDLLNEESDASDRILRLHPDTAKLYFECLHGLKSASHDGDLEHFTVREVRQLLWRFVSESWLMRESLDREATLGRVEEFVSSVTKPQQDWEILWEIELLELTEAVKVGDVEFIRLSEDLVTEWARPKNHPWSEIDQTLIGRAFARTIARAGTNEKALDRAVPLIDDALNILRVAISKGGFVPAFQRLQRRGLYYYALPGGNPTGSHAGARANSLATSLGIQGELREVVMSELDSWELVLGDELPAPIREPIHRALIAIGQSMTRTDVDTKILDLCSALEAIFSTEKEPLKAQRIAIRYMLTGLALDDPSYVTHPLEIYDLYLKRNQIIHGSARRVCTDKDYSDLLYVAKDSIRRVLAVAKNEPSLAELNDLFRHIEKLESLQTVFEFLQDYPTSKDGAAKDVRKLTDWWLARARLTQSTSKHHYQFRETQERGRYEIVLWPVEISRKVAERAGTAIIVTTDVPEQALQQALQLLEERVS